jgi:hypothetical protein
VILEDGAKGISEAQIGMALRKTGISNPECLSRNMITRARVQRHQRTPWIIAFYFCFYLRKLVVSCQYPILPCPYEEFATSIKSSHEPHGVTAGVSLSGTGRGAHHGPLSVW